MTTIVATCSANFVTLAADSGITSDLIHPDMNKITTHGSWLVAVSGEDRVCDVLQYTVTYPKPPVTLLNQGTDAWLAWVVRKVVPAISAGIESNLHKSYHSSLGDSQALLVTHAKAFLISDTLGVTLADPYWSIGSGSHLAMGYLSSMMYASDWHKNHDLIAKMAVESASIHDPYTRGKISSYTSHHTGKIVPR